MGPAKADGVRARPWCCGAGAHPCGPAGGALALGKAALAIAAILALGRLVARPALRAVAETRSREAFLAALLLAVLATALATEAAGLSLALGAFLARLLLAQTEYRPRVEVDLEPFKDLLLGVFLVSVGLSLDPLRVLAEPLAATAGLLALKAGVVFALARLAGEGRGVAAEASLQLGEAVLVGLGAPDEAARALSAERREAIRASLSRAP